MQHRAPRARGELPTFYYHSHFVEMLDFVERHYAGVLSDAQREFRALFSALSFNAQCLYVRLVNRSGRVFARKSLRYPELGDIPAALRELRTAGFVCVPGEDLICEIAQLLTRAELVKALRSVSIPVRSDCKKAELVQMAIEPAHAQAIYKTLPIENLVVQARFDDVQFFLFLFFGQIQDGLSQFTMRDLGLVRTQRTATTYEPRFSDRSDAEHAYFFARTLARLERDPSIAEQLYAQLHTWPVPEVPMAAQLRDELALKLGRLLGHQPDAALDVFGRGESVQCTERTIRLMLSTGRREQARAFLERCMAAPSCDEEALLAHDIYTRKFRSKRTSLATDRLRAAAIIDIDDAYRGMPERAAVQWYERRGLRAFRAENQFWRTLFGLLFWDLLFDSGASGMNSPFERLPALLSERRFLSVHHDRIVQRLALLDHPNHLRQHLLKVCARHFGRINGVFRWSQRMLDAIHAFIPCAPAQPTRDILLSFCRDYLAAKHGYPDLLLIDGTDVRFVEIKADGDQLRRNQLLRLDQLRKAGFAAEIVRIRWVLDPDQAYVVVDVETTGGKAGNHRVTEIGAVKLVNGCVVDRFHTLLNPERAIPAGITQLTGITNAMVADAPVFAQVADDFRAFTQGAIFVAHNVEFDYGFIMREFERLGQRFRRPKLCTCASMRKLYPGLESYGLAALCSRFNIALETHHRALCDAEAAAGLLALINEKRAAQLEHELQDRQADLLG